MDPATAAILPTAPPARDPFRHSETLRVRWAEVDAQHIVFNGHYLMYADTAMAGYWRALALPYPQSVVSLGVDLFVRKATLEYEAAARYDDRIRLGLRCAGIGRSSLRFEVVMHRGLQRLVTGELIYVCADPETMRSQPVPDNLRAVFDAYEAGQPMLTMRHVDRADWADAIVELASEGHRLRVPVGADGFTGLIASCDPGPADAADAAMLRMVAFNRLDRPVAGVRVVLPKGGSSAGEGCIVDLLTHPLLRGSGHGSALLQALLQTARERGVARMRVGLPTAAATQTFFVRAGFRADPAVVTDGPAQVQRIWRFRL